MKENKLRWEVGERVKAFRSEAQEAIGGAIGRFMQNLAQQAAEEGGPGASSPGEINLGGFKIDIGTVKELVALAPQLLQIAQMFGITSGGSGGGGTKNPFLP